MNTKFTILVAAALLIGGVSQAQSAVASNDIAFHNPRHAVVREHREIRKDKHRIHHHRKQMHRHHRTMKHHK